MLMSRVVKMNTHFLKHILFFSITSPYATFIMKCYDFMVEIVHNRNIIFDITPYGTIYYTLLCVTINANKIKKNVPYDFNQNNLIQ